MRDDESFLEPDNVAPPGRHAIVRSYGASHRGSVTLLSQRNVHYIRLPGRARKRRMGPHKQGTQRFLVEYPKLCSAQSRKEYFTSSVESLQSSFSTTHKEWPSNPGSENQGRLSLCLSTWRIRFKCLRSESSHCDCISSTIHVSSRLRRVSSSRSLGRCLFSRVGR